jgi:predicted dehydrogenase
MLGFAHVHAPGYAACLATIPDAELVAVADDQPERLADAVRRFGGEPYDDPVALLGRGDVEAVVVMAENARHRELVVAAAEAGKHVLCEKPLATTRADGLAMVETCRERGVKLGTVFPVRFNPAAIALRQAIEDGAIGAPLAVKATNPGQVPPGWFTDPALAGGGAVMDHTVHVADLLRWIFGREIVEVYAEVDTLLHRGLPVDDVGVLMLRLAGGLTASLDASWSRPKSWPTGAGLTMEVVGEGGVVAMDAFRANLQLVEDRGPSHRLLPWAGGGDAALVEDFMAAVREDREPLVTGEDGLRALEVALCAYESARRREPVACPGAPA